MALFDPATDPVLDVDTPQGPMRLPASVANALGLSPVQPPAVPQLGVSTMGPRGTESVPGGPVAAPPPPPPPPPPPVDQGAGSGRKGGSPSRIGASVTGQNEVPAMPIAAPAAARPVAPAGQGGIPTFSQEDLDAVSGKTPPAPAQQKPTTADDLRNFGIGGMLDSQLGALDDQKKAGEAAANTEAAEQAAFANAYEDRNAKIDDLLQQRANDAKRKQAEIASRTAEYDAAVQKYATTKIDRSVDHPILAAISLALGAFGSAMKGSGENPALQVLFQQIDRKVQGQMADQAKLGQIASMKRGDIDLLRQTASDSTAQYNQMIAGETLKAANQVEAIGARSNSQIVKAKAIELAAQMKQKAADAVGTAVMAQQGKDERDRAFAEQQKEHRESLGVQYAGLSQQDKHFKMSLDEQIREHDLARQDKLDELALGYAKLGQKDKADAAKAQASTGVFDPTSGNAVLTPEGQKLLDQADALDVKARTAKPDDAEKLRTQAKQIRDQAEVDYGFRIEDKDARREIVKSVGAGQKLIDTIARIKQTLGQDPSSVDRSTWAALKTDFESAKADWIEAHKGKPSSREFEAISDMFGDDPESLSARVAGRGKMIASLDRLSLNAVSDTTTDLRANGYKGQWRPRALQTEEIKPLQGQTAVEAGQAAEPGPLGKAYRAVATGSTAAPAGGGVLNPERRAEEGGDVTPTGLTKQDTATVQTLAKQYAGATDAKRAQIVSQLQAYASSDRASLANGVLGLVKGENPALYQDVVQGLAPTQQQNLGVDVRSRAQVLASTPLDQLQMGGLVGDRDSINELARRVNGGDKAAGQVLLRIVNAKGSK